MSYFRLPTILCFCLCLCARADEPVDASTPSRQDQFMAAGMEVTGVRAPYYDDEGNLKAQLYGGHAKILEVGVAEVKDIRIDVFEDGAAYMTVYAPQCITRIIEKNGKKTLAVESQGYVLVEMEQMTITGRGFRFASENNRFEILNDSKVLVKKSARDTKGVGL